MRPGRRFVEKREPRDRKKRLKRWRTGAENWLLGYRLHSSPSAPAATTTTRGSRSTHHSIEGLCIFEIGIMNEKDSWVGKSRN